MKDVPVQSIASAETEAIVEERAGRVHHSGNPITADQTTAGGSALGQSGVPSTAGGGSSLRDTAAPTRPPRTWLLPVPLFTALEAVLHIQLDTVFRALVALIALASPLMFVYVAWHRIDYPFDLEWMEGGMLCHVLRLLEGAPLFSAPSVSFTPYIYQPLYASVVALLSLVFGPSLLLARAVSVVCTVAVAALVGKTVLRETGQRLAALISGCLIFAWFPVTGYWLDLARVDPFYLALVFGALYLARYHGGTRRGIVLATACVVGAWFTKQTSALYIPLVLASLSLYSPRRALLALAAMVGVIGLTTLLLHLSSEGWYTYYTYTLVTAEPYLRDRLLSAFWIRIWSDAPWVLGAAGLAAVLELSPRTLGQGLRETWILAPLAGLVNALVTWSRPGGYDNNFLPFYVFSTLAAGLILARALKEKAQWIGWAALAGCVLQLGHLRYDAEPNIPSSLDRAAGEELVSLLRASPGEVLIPEHPYYAVLAGKKPSFHIMGQLDVQFREGMKSWPEDYLAGLRAQRWAMIVTSWKAGTPSLGNYPQELLTYYREAQTLSLPGRRLDSFTGTSAAPTFVYRPIAPSWQALDITTTFDEGNFRGWTCTGTAFGKAPVAGPFPNQLPIIGNRGAGFINTYVNSADQDQGMLTSRWFRNNARTLRFLIGGGADEANLGVQLWSEQGLVRRAAGRNTEVLEEVVWDLLDLQGQLLQLRIVDASAAPWGHTLVDEIRFE